MSMTGLLVILVMMGESSLAADVGIVQAVTLALFHSFSANARSLIFSQTSPAGAYSIMGIRLALILPLSALAFWLSQKTAGVDAVIAGGLVFRRAIEWLSEVHACEMERRQQIVLAWRYFAAQTVSLLVVVTLILFGESPWAAFFVWGVAPALLGARFALESLRAMASPNAWKISTMMPHFGSSAINGVAVYIFRLLVLVTVGKALGGELFAAFAVGGVIGSVFANVLGPSVVMHEQRTGKRHSEKLISYFLRLFLLGGAAITGGVLFGGSLDGWFGRTTVFWLAVGLSMIGGVVMVHAQRIRLELIQQHDAERDVFGPDVLMNILIVAAIPFLSYFGGAAWAAALYLLSAVLAFLFYGSAMIRETQNAGIGKCSLENIRIGLALLLILPVFFQWSEWIFQSKQLHFDSGGVLANLPIPISVLACYVGMLLLGKYGRANLSLTIVFSTFVLMVMSSLTTFHGDRDQEQAKLVLIIQYVLPMLALVLGQMYEGKPKPGHKEAGFERTMFWGGLTVMSCHLLASWLQGSMVLVPNLYLFSIYQYLENVPVVLISAVLIGYFGMAQNASCDKNIPAVALIVGMYIGASVSPFFLFCFAALFFLVAWLRGGIEKKTLSLFILGSVVAGIYVLLGLNLEISGKRNGYDHQTLLSDVALVFDNMLNAWNHHIQGVLSDPRAFLFGHPDRPSRYEYPSAYNYYLGFVYNFGLLPVLPLVGGLFFTGISAFRTRQLHNAPGMLAFSAALAFLLLIQNSVSVAMQQPYPAIVTFFLWGVYLSRVVAGTPAIQEQRVR